MSLEDDLEVIDAVRMTVLSELRAGIHVGNHIICAEDDRICIGGTRIALELLKRYHIFGRALKVHVVIYNRVGWEWQQEHPDRPLLGELEYVQEQVTADMGMGDVMGLLTTRGVPEKARIRFCGLGTDMPSSLHLSDPGWLNGHAVALLDVEGTPVLLDATAQQFTTPEFKLFVPPLMFTVDPEWATDPGASWAKVEPEELNGGAMFYRQPRDLDGMFSAGDWKDGMLDKDLPGALDVLQRKVNERLELVRL